MLKYSEFIKEGKDKNLVFGGVEFNITRQELDYALLEIKDVFPELDVQLDNCLYSDLVVYNALVPNLNFFIITLDCYDNSETDDNYRDNYKNLHYLEPKIFECIKYFQDKMNYYGLDVLYSDFKGNDTEYEIIVGKKGTKLDLKENK